MEFLDESGNLIKSDYDNDYLWLFNANSGFSGDEDRFTLHPNDKYLFFDKESYKSGGVKVAKVRFVMDKVERFQPPIAYSEYNKKELNWLSKKVDYLDFDLRVRDESFYADQYSTARQYLSFEITHTGTKDCRELLLLIEWLKSNGQVIKKHELPVVTLKHKPVPAGTKLITTDTYYFEERITKAPFASYRVSVKTAD